MQLHPCRHHVVGRSLLSPSSSTFLTEFTTSSVILGLGAGVSIRDVLPLKNSFLNWCVKYFKDPQMRVHFTINIFFQLYLKFDCSKQKLMSQVVISIIIKDGDQCNNQIIKDTQAEAPITGRLFQPE